ncbi:Scopoletin glucosyltransferase [Datura stramonium]|uniref:Scopoletin glucosyltransferase n=1 Tax=Datura stramonium TaxID=4076 RepID=A0ABS8UQU2_DATST|nr:Scopoletin glucosyltransferase [Datura stramonium]
MGQLHFFFFPMMAQGHMIPTLDMAKLVACRGVKATIITTPLNEYVFSKAIERNKHLGIEIDIRLIKFPAVENGLPEECERLDLIPSDDKLPNFFKAVAMMQEPLEQLIEECRPNCLVSDMFLPWTTDTAAKFNIPRIVFHGTSYFALCVGDSIRRNKPFKYVSSDSETFVVPNLPHEIKLTRTQLSPFEQSDEESVILDDQTVGPFIRSIMDGLKYKKGTVAHWNCNSDFLSPILQKEIWLKLSGENRDTTM